MFCLKVLTCLKTQNHSELEWDFLAWLIMGVKYYSHIWFLHTTGLLRYQGPQKSYKDLALWQSFWPLFP